MGQERQYAVIDPPRGGKRAALVLIIAMIASVAVLVGAVFLGIKLASLAGQDESESPPAPVAAAIPPYNTTIKADSTGSVQWALLFLEGQKSGHLPDDYPCTWRNNSGLSDGFDQNRNLTGGFYDGGGNVKYTFPMAFSVTMLSWAVIDYGAQFDSIGEADRAISLIQWGVDYLLAAKYKDIIFAQVGIPEIEDFCWTRPEDMPKRYRITPYPCEPQHPCSDLAAEMAAALAAASIIFRDPNKGNPVYADQIVATAEELFTFADTYRGKYSDWVVEAQAEYNSTGYLDELMWGAAWLFYATGKDEYRIYLSDPSSQDVNLEKFGNVTAPAYFNWDKKSPAVAVLVTRILSMGYGLDQQSNTSNTEFANLLQYGTKAIGYVGQFIDTNMANFTDIGSTTGLMWVGPRDGDLLRPLEGAVNNLYLTMVLIDYLYPSKTYKVGVEGLATPFIVGVPWETIIQNYLDQLNYILGNNPIKMSYMTGWNGYGTNYPKYVYHKGSSIPSYRVDPIKYNCITGNQWLISKDPNPNFLLGALVGGPAKNDSFANDRTNRNQSEPKTHMNAVFAGFLAGTIPRTVRPGIVYYDRMWPKLPWAAKKAREIEATLQRSPPPPPSVMPPPPPAVFTPP